MECTHSPVALHHLDLHSGSLLALPAASLATKSVVIYMDRAEVKRVIDARLHKGINELLIQNVSAVIERESVRVDGDGVLIQEVHYQEIPIDSLTENDKVRELEKYKTELEAQRAALDDDISSIRRRIEVLDGIATQMSNGVPPQSTLTRRNSQSESSDGSVPVAAPFVLNDEALNNLSKFLSYYGNTVSGLKAELRERSRRSDALSEKLDSLERQIDQLRCGFEYDSITRNISIVVEVEADADVQLFLTYQVYCASWKPTYDLRASTASDQDKPNSIKLCYFGLIEQNTGDDWRDADVVLSTATPCIGGSAPQLSTLAATFRRPNKRFLFENSFKSFSERQRHASARRKPQSAASEEDGGFGSYEYAEMTDAAALHRAVVHLSDEGSTSATSLDGLSSACFAIPRAVTVPSNGIEHKLDLDCAFLYDSVPSRTASAFLSALVTNTSTFPLLAGPVSVYLNNGFVSRTQLSAVGPGEEFLCALGVDPAVKVEYRAPTRAHEQVKSGLMSKSMLLTHEQTVCVRNAKVAQSVQITIREQIPKSTDDKIKVTMLSPDVKGGATSREARLNRDHNLEWTLILAPGQQRELDIKYTIEYPVNETLSYRVLA